MTTMLKPTQQADALLLVLEAVNNGDVVPRRSLEKVAQAAGKEEILRAFATANWRRRLYESLAHLEQAEKITRSPVGYTLTDEGRASLSSLSCPAPALSEIRGRLKKLATSA